MFLTRYLFVRVFVFDKEEAMYILQFYIHITCVLYLYTVIINH